MEVSSAITRVKNGTVMKNFLKVSLVGLVVVSAGWLLFLLKTTGAGRPVCLKNFSQPSREAIIRQGVWSHLQALPAIRAVDEGREGGRRGDPEAPIDLVAVNDFLSKYPECCRIAAPGDGMGKVRRAVDLYYGREIVYVAVEDPTLKSKEGNQIHFGLPEINACNKNLERIK